MIELVVLIGLATWRLSYMLVRETGPWGVFTRLRKLTGIIHDDAGEPIGVPDGNVLGCVWCTSVWVALVLVWMPAQVLLILAASALAVIVNEKLKS